VSSYLSLHKTDTCSTGTRDIYANEEDEKEEDDEDEEEVDGGENEDEMEWNRRVRRG